MTVAKRFFRSKLSVIGLAVIVFLFLFSFIGPLFSPWKADNGTALDYGTINSVGTYESFEYIGADGEMYEAFDVT
ncbi:MAG: ABC transporter permease, partial [Clostridia bacterium]|nr:ABC transporter permease [Clostridia bacterium]